MKPYYSSGLGELYFGDCLEVSSEITKKAALICIDPPYNIGKDVWDKIKDYESWMGEIFKLCQKSLADNGSFYWFHNKMPVIARLMGWIEDNTDFIFKQFIIWDKGDFRALAWKNPSEDSDLRSWFTTCEYCLFYTFQDETGLKLIDEKYISPRNPFRNELKRSRMAAGLTITEVAEKGAFYGKINHGGAVTNWEKGLNVPLKEQWETLKTFLPIRKEYEGLRKEYEGLRYTHNVFPNHKNIWKLRTRNKSENHPTEKPIDIIMKIIQTSSNPNDLCVDFFGGSGTLAVACENLGRRWWICEKSEKYCEIAANRIDEAASQMSF